jgi:hypothetical protein
MNTPGDAHRDRRARQHGGELALPARGRPLPARLLHGMGRVEDHRRAGRGHDRQGAHVGDERVVAEGGAALGQHDVGLPAEAILAATFAMSQGARNWPFLTLTTRPFRRGDEEIGLAAEEGGDLQDVDRLGRPARIARLVHVGEHGQAVALADLGEDRQRRLDPDAARA